MPTATSLVNKLCATQLVIRVSDKLDRRIVKLEITSQGKELLKKAKGDYMKRINKTLSYLTISEKQIFLKILQKLIGKLEEKYEK
jgi:DNA-binding MarR family transcriptional regulator